MGGMGRGNMSNFMGFPEVRVVAVCDVDRNHLETARAAVEAHYAADMESGVYRGCDAYHEFEELIARSDIDILSLALPDHWHSIPAILGARAGKDMYGEKPLSRTVTEGRAMVDAVTQYSRVWQTGSWQRSVPHFRRACELVRNGRIGRVHRVLVGLPATPVATRDPVPVRPVPEGFDYDRWLGPAPWAPYKPERCHFHFRWIRDYAAGMLSDWGAHHIDIAQWGLGTDRTGPVWFEGEGEFPTSNLYDTAVNFRFTAGYPDGVEVVVTDQAPLGTRFEGEHGWVFVNRGGLQTEPSRLVNERIGPGEIHLYESANHIGNFLECVRHRGETATPIEVAHRSNSVANLGEIAMFLGRRLHWDPDRERFVDDDEANRMLSRSMRSPWRL
jgi:predicted dehydrogenase